MASAFVTRARDRATQGRLPVRPRQARSTTAIPGPRRRSAEIIDAAARVFARLGYHGTTTTDIADELGIRQASLYYYFASKEAALEAVVLRGVEGHANAARAILASGAPVREKLDRLVRAHLAPVAERGDYVRVFLKERHRLPSGSRRRIGRQSRAIERIFESVIAEGIGDGSFRRDADPRLSTLAILGMCNAVPDWWRNEGRTMDEIAQQFSAMALAGLAGGD